MTFAGCIQKFPDFLHWQSFMGTLLSEIHVWREEVKIVTSLGRFCVFLSKNLNYFFLTNEMNFIAQQKLHLTKPSLEAWKSGFCHWKKSSPKPMQFHVSESCLIFYLPGIGQSSFKISSHCSNFFQGLLKFFYKV